jgi:two-component system, OmpR family, heavy metal sensor histidine kinase CusS
MFSKRTEPRSIATQLVLLFTLCAVLLLSCSLGLFYWIVVQHAFEEDNAVLADKLAAIDIELKQPDGTSALAQELKNRRTGEPVVYWIRIIHPDGNIVAETPEMARLLPTSVFPSPTNGSRLPTDYRSDGKLFSVLARSEPTDRGTYIVQVAQDRTADERFRRQFRALLAIGLGLGVIVSALIAITVTKRGLSPLARMRRAFERIQPAHLSERIEPTRWPPELRPLAASFDDMLGRLEDSFTRLSQFSADLAHELRTPIGNILGEAQVALTRERKPDEYRAVIESTAAECERLSGIIENLLFLARADAAEQQVTRSSFNARAVVEKIITFYQTLAEDRHIEISCDGDAEISADSILFNRAIGNLLDNALRFTPENGKIRIAISTTESGTEISVSDNGPGIPPEHLPRVFDRFYRADPSRSSVGTGLGLALVKSIVDLHGGSAAIHSEVGHGTTVQLTFPGKSASDRS